MRQMSHKVWGNKEEKMRLWHLLHEVLIETTLAQLVMLLYPQPNSMLYPWGIDCNSLQVVNIHKFRVYKAVSRPGVNKSSEWDFIKVILTKDQERSKRNKEWMRIGKSRYIELNQTHCCTGKFNTVLSLCGVLGVALYFSKGFLEAAARRSAVAEVPWPLGETVVCFLGQESSL